MNFSELISFLHRIGRRPNRGLSQNFLIDENIASNIIKMANIVPGDTVLEIGPGPGALTSHLLGTGATVIAIEKDPVFARELSRLSSGGQLISICQDILKYKLQESYKLQPRLASTSKIKVVANLPYHITTPILEKLLAESHMFSTLTLMIQSELAARMFASAGSKDFGSLSLFIPFHTTLIDSFKVSESCFYPRPKVTSKVLHLALRTPPLKMSAPFFTIVRRAFQERRKMIRSSLQKLYPVHILEQALHSAQVKADARPETLSLEQWLLVYDFLI